MERNLQFYPTISTLNVFLTLQMPQVLGVWCICREGLVLTCMDHTIWLQTEHITFIELVPIELSVIVWGIGDMVATCIVIVTVRQLSTYCRHAIHATQMSCTCYGACFSMKLIYYAMHISASHIAGQANTLANHLPCNCLSHFLSQAPIHVPGSNPSSTHGSGLAVQCHSNVVIPS